MNIRVALYFCSEACDVGCSHILYGIITIITFTCVYLRSILVYNEADSVLYCHHDIILPAFPLSTAWLNYDIETKQPGNLLSPQLLDCASPIRSVFSFLRLNVGENVQIAMVRKKCLIFYRLNSAQVTETVFRCFESPTNIRLHVF